MSRRLLLPVVLLAACGVGWMVLRHPPAAARAVPYVGNPYDGSGAPRGSLPRPTRPPNLVLIAVDTLRADAVRPGAGRTPYLASLAESGVRFRDAMAPAPWTSPAMASLLTGLLPSDTRSADVRRTAHVPDGVATFAEILTASYGYDTAAFMDGPWWAEPSNLLQGFAFAKDGFGFRYAAEDLDPWLKRRDPRRPFFLLLHTMEAHDPYGAHNHERTGGPRAASALPRISGDEDPALLTRLCLLDRVGRSLVTARGREVVAKVVRYRCEGFAEDPDPVLAADLRAAYLGGVAAVDASIGRTMRLLRERGLLENTLIAFVGDHGEAFGEHGYLGHGVNLYDETLRIPLVLAGLAPFEGGREISGTVGLTDVLPTFFDVAGFPLPSPLEGRSLLPVLRGDSPGRPVVSEEVLSDANVGRDIEANRFSVRTNRWRFVITHDRTDGSVLEELYDVIADPGELENLATRSSAGFDLVDDETCRAIHALRQRVATDLSADRERNGLPEPDLASAKRASPPGPCEPPRGSS